MRPADFVDPFKGRPGVFHLASDHLETIRLFSDKESFCYGVNTLALAVARFGIRLFCYELMDSHLHVLSGGTWTKCREFFRWVLHRLAMMISARDGVSDILPRDGFDVHAVLDPRQFQNEVAYILRNCYKARICSPFSYEWGSIDVYFNPARDLLPGTSVSSMGTVEIRRLLKTRGSVPPRYEVRDGRILNRCFVDYTYVEQQFGDSLKFFDVLRVWDLESAVALSHGVSEQVTFSDAELAIRLSQLCRTEYGTDSVQLLDRKSLLLLARTASRSFGAGKNQLARLLNLSADMLGKVL